MPQSIEETLYRSLGISVNDTLLSSMAICAAMEAAGSFLRGKTGNGESGKNFKKFCNSKYMPTKYKKYTPILWNLFRNGLMHTYFAKGSAFVTDDEKAQKLHLKLYRNYIIICPKIMGVDVKDAIKRLEEEVKKNVKLKRKRDKVLKKNLADGEKFYKKFLNEKKLKPRETLVFRTDITTEIR